MVGTMGTPTSFPLSLQPTLVKQTKKLNIMVNLVSGIFYLSFADAFLLFSMEHFFPIIFEYASKYLPPFAPMRYKKVYMIKALKWCRSIFLNLLFI